MNETRHPSQPPAVTIIPGDGIGPEVVAAARRIIDAPGSSCGTKPSRTSGAPPSRAHAGGTSASERSTNCPLPS